MNKLTVLPENDSFVSVKYVETQLVKDGVECDIYTFDANTSRDLAVVRVAKGFKTPLQKILKGDETIEKYVKGTGTLTVTNADGSEIVHTFPNEAHQDEVVVGIGQTMQWAANEDLVFYEICTPPYEDGRFENLPE